MQAGLHRAVYRITFMQPVKIASGMVNQHEKPREFAMLMMLIFQSWSCFCQGAVCVHC